MYANESVGVTNWCESLGRVIQTEGCMLFYCTARWAVVLTNTEYEIDILKKNVRELRHLYRKYLSEDIEFYRAITSSTGTRKNIGISIEVIRNLWEKCYDKIN